MEGNGVGDQSLPLPETSNDSFQLYALLNTNLPNKIVVRLMLDQEWEKGCNWTKCRPVIIGLQKMTRLSLREGEVEHIINLESLGTHKRSRSSPPLNSFYSYLPPIANLF